MRSVVAAGLAFAAGAALADPAWASHTVHTLVHPFVLPYRALQPFDSVNNPFGYPQNPSGSWPVTLGVGDIDNDGRKDVLLCMEQHLLLALGFNVDAQGKPTSTYVIWAWFTPNGTMNKTPWGRDRASISDFNGDGLNEVAAVVDPGPSGPASCGQSMRLAILGGTPAPDPGFGNVPRPQILDQIALDSALAGFSNFLIPACSTGGGPGNVAVSTFNYDGNSYARDILVSETQRGVLCIFHWNGPGAGFATRYSQPYQGSWTHYPYGFDLDGEGHDELLGEGVRSFFPNSCYWNISNVGTFTTCVGSGSNHADMLVPWDRDNDGINEILVTHDCYDLVLEPNPRYCNLIASPAGWAPPAEHGQDVTVARLVNDSDVFGYSGDSYVSTPKGGPIWNNGNSWGSYAMNGDGDLLCLNINSATPTIVSGPNGWGVPNLDWDGDRSVDEIYSKLANHHSVFQLELDPSPSPPYPYRWTELAGFDDTVGGQYANSPADLFSDYREEIVAAGRYGIQIAQDTGLVHPWHHLTPFEDKTYRRRYSGGCASVDYQALFRIDRLRVSPLTLVCHPGDQVPFQVEGVYVNDAGEEQTRDVTADCVMVSGNTSIASFSGNMLKAHSDGLVVLNAYLGGYKQEDVPLALVGNNNQKNPLIVYAGYANTYLSQAAGPQDLVVEARVVDYQNNVAGLVVNRLNTPPSIPPQAANDSGLSGDRRANDGIWTFRLPSVSVVAPADYYYEVKAFDATAFESLKWPWLQVGAASTLFGGLATNPLQSELITTSPPPLRLLGTGLYPAQLQSGGTGIVTVFAFCQDPRVASIQSFAQSSVVALGFNDLGNGADAFAGDGLWSGQWQITTPLLDGRHTLDTLPRNVPQALIGDAFPRLRFHN